MTDTTSRPVAERHRVDESTSQHDRKGDLRSPESRGHTEIADSVVEKIAGMATREVPGVHNLGTGMARAVGGVRERMPGTQPSVTRGVQVEVGERQAAVDLDVVVDYGFPIAEIAAGVRTNVISAVERLTSLDVVEVNVAVDDIDLPDLDDDEQGAEQRVD